MDEFLLKLEGRRPPGKLFLPVILLPNLWGRNMTGRNIGEF
jgi:hypothetical protein